MTDLEIRRVKDKGEIPGPKRELLDDYEDGLSEYRKKKWQKAIDLFEKALKIDPHDGPSITYIERCGLYTGTASRGLGWCLYTDS